MAKADGKDDDEMGAGIGSADPKIAWSSYKERGANALALGADERRDKLR